MSRLVWVLSSSSAFPQVNYWKLGIVSHWFMYWSEFSRGTEPVGDTYRRRFIIMYRLTWLWDWEFPWSAICKLETQENWWCSLKAWELEGWWRRFHSECEGLGTRSAEGSRRLMPQHKKRGREQIQPSSTSLFYSGPQPIGWYTPTLGKAICFT